MATTSWRRLILNAMKPHGETWDDVVAEATESYRDWNGDPEVGHSLDCLFDSGYGMKEGCRFTVWTRSRVYFPCLYDGAEWVGSVPRNPCAEAAEHMGSG